MTFVKKRKTSLPIEDPNLNPSSSPAKRLKQIPIQQLQLQDPLLNHSYSHSSLEELSRKENNSFDGFLHTDNTSSPLLDKNRHHLFRIIQSTEKETLSRILTCLLLEHPHLESQVQPMLPKPSLENVSRLLNDSEKRLNEVFPYSKNAPGRMSDYSFNRVRPFLTELKDQILFYLQFFVSPDSYTAENDFEYPETAMAYLRHVSELVQSRLPVWQNPILNKETKQELLEKLSQGWRCAVLVIVNRVQNGKIFPAPTVREWADGLVLFTEQVHGEFGMKLVCQEFMQGLGWLFDSAGLNWNIEFSGLGASSSSTSVSQMGTSTTTMSLGSSHVL